MRQFYARRVVIGHVQHVSPTYWTLPRGRVVEPFMGTKDFVKFILVVNGFIGGGVWLIALGLGFKVQGLGLRVQGEGKRV